MRRQANPRDCEIRIKRAAVRERGAHALLVIVQRDERCIEPYIDPIRSMQLQQEIRHAVRQRAAAQARRALNDGCFHAELARCCRHFQSDPAAADHEHTRTFTELRAKRDRVVERAQVCVTPSIASAWAERLLGTTTRVLGPDGHREFFTGTTACLSALYGAQRYDELIRLVDSARFNWWHYRRWGVDALMAQGRPAEALRYAQASQQSNAPLGAVAKACETILLQFGMIDEAYARYAIIANEGTTHLATFRAIVKKYPHKQPGDVLLDLVASDPGSEGKWFAAAKDAGLFELAASLAKRSPTDPRTLTRAARDFGDSQPDFAMSCGLSALHWMAAGYGYDNTRIDVLDAYAAIVHAGETLGIATAEINARIRARLDMRGTDRTVVEEALAHYIR